MGETDIVVYSENQERIDSAIWKGLGTKSVRAIAEEVGLTPDEVLKRKNELRDEIDVLTVQEKRQKILIDLEEMSAKLRGDYDNAPFEFKSGIMNSSVSAMKTVLAELARMEKADSGEVERLNQMRVRELFDLIRETIQISVSQIAEAHGLSETDLNAVFKANLVIAAERRDMTE